MVNRGYPRKPLALQFGAFGWGTTISFVYFLAQLAIGTDFRVAILFTLAIALGLAAVQAGGGLRSAYGLLNAILISKFLLLGVALKILLMEPTDSNLMAPVTTGWVMAFGFLSLWLATMALQRLPRPKKPFMPASYSAREYLALTIVLLVLTYAGYLIGMSPDLEGQGLQTGGILGYARTFGSFRSFAIVAVMFYVWKAGHKRFLTHPLVLSVLLLQTAAGILATGKLEAVEPLFFYGVVAVLRLGVANRRIWILATLAAIFYVGIVYPYSQYVRNNGGRQGNAAYRVETITDTLWRLMTDPNFRDVVSARIDLPSKLYWNAPSFAPFSRLAMVCEADRLIAATERTQGFTGWETITWGFKLLTPHVLLPSKPVYPAANYLAHIAGDASPQNTDTQWSYGVFANFYNAFGLTGVFLGGLCLFVAFYYLLSLFFGNPRWAPGPTAASLGLILVVGSYHHTLVESSVSGVIASASSPFILFSMCLMARWLARLFPSLRQQPTFGRVPRTASPLRRTPRAPLGEPAAVDSPPQPGGFDS